MKAQVCGKENMLLRDRNDLNSDPDDLIERRRNRWSFTISPGWRRRR
ncbi:MAG: hypothetical protein ACXVB2_07610 [Isosphaeraceae bacterium]